MECALELYCPMLTRWEPHTYFKLPVSEPLEMQLNLIPHGKYTNIFFVKKILKNMAFARSNTFVRKSVELLKVS